jgi:hypothetical protein
MTSEERLRNVLKAAVEAIRTCPDYQDTDQVIVILGDMEHTNITTSGQASSLEIAGLLRFHANKLDRIG